MSLPTDGASTQPEKEKLEILVETHTRVLNAFTTQEERIGRLLTGVSFLTAAVLALAALSSAIYVVKRFEMTPYKVPLPLAIVVVFLATIILSVLLMVSAVTRPVGLPIVTRRLDEYKGRGSLAFVKNSSQIDYHEIDELSLSEWRGKWEKDEIEEIREVREDSMVRDIYRLALRAAFSHDRVREAGAILRYSLLAFIAAVFIVGISAYSTAPLTTPEAGSVAIVPQGAVITLKDYERLILGIIFGSYFWLEVMLSNRAEQQEVKPESGERWLDVADALRVDSKAIRSRPTRLLRQVFAASMFFFVVLALPYVSGWPLPVFMAAEGVLILLIVLSFIMMSRGSEVNKRRRLIIVAVILTPAFGVTFSEYNGWYVGQFAAVWFASLVLLTIIVSQPTISLIRRRRYREVREKEANRERKQDQALWFSRWRRCYREVRKKEANPPAPPAGPGQSRASRPAPPRV